MIHYLFNIYLCNNLQKQHVTPEDRLLIFCESLQLSQDEFVKYKKVYVIITMKLKELTDFWTQQADEPDRIQFVNFVDGESQEVEIKNWKVFVWEYQGKNWDNAQLLETVEGKYLKINNKSLKKQLLEYKGQHMRFEITRYDSAPNPLNTWYNVRVKKLTQKSSVKN